MENAVKNIWKHRENIAEVPNDEGHLYITQ
jgi:hypothetical protein